MPIRAGSNVCGYACPNARREILMNPAARWPLWIRMSIAVILGGLAAFGLAPTGLWPLTLVMMLAVPALFGACTTPRQAALTGWALGMGWFAHGLIWIVEPFLVDAARYGWMAPFAIALMALVGSSVQNVIIAISVPEIPRVVRLVRAIVLTIREMPYVEAAVASGTRLPQILVRHILPNTFAPLMVQATYICASAVIVEAYLSFLGAGTPPEIPSWGNMMAEGRVYFQFKPWLLFFPGLCLACMVMTVNILGDGLRDTLDPRIARGMR